MKKFISLMVIFIIITSFAGFSFSAEKLKAAFVYVGPVGDGGWTYSHNEGRIALDKNEVETAYVESVPEGAEAERTITRFAAEGYDVVFTTSYGYMDTTIQVAKKFPEVVFGHCSGHKRAENVFTYYGRMYQPIYLSGIIAGKMTKSGKIGYVAPHPIPEVIRHVNVAAMGAREVKPDAAVHVVWTGAWFDPGKEKEAAVALMDAGCDIIITEGDSPAALQAAEKRGFYSIGYNSDGRSFAPESFLTASIWDWSVVYQDVIDKIKAGFSDWENLDYWDGLESGVVKLAPFSDFVPEDVQKMIEDRTKELENEDDIFVGPLKDQNGTVKIKEGVKMTDKEILHMDWLVEGVVGNLPG
ncbi:BMP family ABC transporter substrate-binding protein [Candidatus Poribacteria bacterium]|nr:BMP family ABC transporter substrate-binding protein [Candidatus Poribacteria bacterium]